MWPALIRVYTLKSFEGENVYFFMQSNTLLVSSSKHALIQLQQHIFKSFFKIFI